MTFAQNIITWQRNHGRHDLPWQNTTDAYRIWLSEIMLQQTQVVTVMDYYAKFLQRFPTVHELAHTPLDDVLALWAGLGYYSRARNLHHCAQQVVQEFAGQFPRTPAQLMTLKGIGASTAAAIAVFAYGHPATILDGNVKRILSRYFLIANAPSAATDKTLWAHAERELIGRDDAAELTLSHADALRSYTQGLMDLGATLCTRSKPQCSICPLYENCIARQRDLCQTIPAVKTRTAVKNVHIDLYIYRHNHALWLEKRPQSGIWASLFSFPEHDSLNQSHSANEFALQPHIAHRLTHRQLYLQPHVFDINADSARILEERADTYHPEGAIWLTLETLDQVGLPKPIAVLAHRLLSAPK